ERRPSREAVVRLGLPDPCRDIPATPFGGNPAGIPPYADRAGPNPRRASAGHLPPLASPLLSPGRESSAAGSIPAGIRSVAAGLRPLPLLSQLSPAGGPRAPAALGGARRVDWACSAAERRGAAGARRMHSPGRAVQGPRAQGAALADALASLGRTRARMASLTAYDKDVSSGSYNLSSATTGSYYSCVSQITIGYDVAGPVAIGLTHWKNPYVQGRPTLPSDLPLFVSKDAGIPVYHRSFTRKTDQATPLSCPASLSITPVPSYSSSSQETLSQDTT
ncbi:hypothetical protein H8959_015084, partial [Pygathrix nigripes]